MVAQYGDSPFAPEAMYWRAVVQYSATQDHTVLGKVAEELRSKYPSSVWASKAVPWLHKGCKYPSTVCRCCALGCVRIRCKS